LKISFAERERERERKKGIEKGRDRYSKMNSDFYGRVEIINVTPCSNNKSIKT